MPTYHPALTGAALDAMLETTTTIRPALIEGLLYERSVILLSADAGIGKSTLVANILAQASVGLPVFNVLYVPKPLLCYYIPFERGSEELRERLKQMRSVIPFNTANLCIFENPDFPCPNLYDPAHQRFLLDSIQQDCPTRPPDVVFYDPIYQAVAGGLSNEDKVSAFIRFNVQLMTLFGCATWLNHHTGKTFYAADGQKVEKDDPYYGSSFLRNHCTGSYYLHAAKDHDGTILDLKKDNLGTLLKRLMLHYDPETYTSSMKDAFKDLLAVDRLKLALRQFKLKNQSFTFRQLQGCMMGVSDSRLREILRIPHIKEAIISDKSNPQLTLYLIKGEI